MLITKLFGALQFLAILWINEASEVDPNGYLAYCPCMGRFGNQADHFLGTFAFAKALNRTLILPPWIEYRKGEMRSIQIPFDKYFQVQPLEEYHRVTLMADFMKELAPMIWPEEKRIAFCYKERTSLNKDKADIKDCHAKDGNPFGPFWDEFQIDFVKSEFYGPLHFDVHHSNMVERWHNHYPPSKWPVLAFTGAPASFPIQSENRHLQKYLKWSKLYEEKAKDFIKNHLPKGAFVGIHLRNGIDWVRACEHIKDGQHLFASPQCLGYNNEKGRLYPELCMQTKEMVIRQLKRTIKNFKQTYKGNDIRSIFVASDSNHMISELTLALTRMDIKVFKLPQDEPYLDLAILGLSNHFIGNCISSYSAFVKRERDANGFPSSFWGFPKDKDKSQHRFTHEEL